MIIVNPNFHLKCEDPGTCIFSGGTQALTTLPTSDIGLAAAFVGSLGLTLPEGWLPESSNLLVEGIVFEGGSDLETGDVSDMKRNPWEHLSCLAMFCLLHI